MRSDRLGWRFDAAGLDPQAPAAAAVVMTTVLRAGLRKAIESVYAQDLQGGIQLLIGIDKVLEPVEPLLELLRQRPAQVSALVLDPGYSTSTRHGGLHPAHDGGSLRTVLSFLANSRRVASASLDRTVKVWDAATGQEVLGLRGPVERMFSVAFSPDGRRLAAGSYDGIVYVWDAAAGQGPRLTLPGHLGACCRVAKVGRRRHRAVEDFHRDIDLFGTKEASRIGHRPDAGSISGHEWPDGHSGPHCHAGTLDACAAAAAAAFRLRVSVSSTICITSSS